MNRQGIDRVIRLLRIGHRNRDVRWFSGAGISEAMIRIGIGIGQSIDESMLSRSSMSADP